MSWTDKGAIKVIKFLRDKYKIQTLVETGTFKGINAQLHSKNFKTVFTCEKKKEYYKASQKRLEGIKNINLRNEDSKKFLKHFSSDEMLLFYLDAHFYDPGAENTWVVLDELKALQSRGNSIIIIHDFDNNLGHITYEGQPLNLDLIRKELHLINKDFFFYTNTLDSCDPVKPTIEDIKKSGLQVDEETIDNLEYAWTSARLTYRGLLYCLPTKLTKVELKKTGLREWN